MGICLVVYLVLCLSEKTDRLLALVHQVLHEDLEVLVLVQKLNAVFIVPEDLAQVLVRIREDVQDERGRVLEVHASIGAEIHYLVH